MSDRSILHALLDGLAPWQKLLLALATMALAAFGLWLIIGQNQSSPAILSPAVYQVDTDPAKSLRSLMGVLHDYYHVLLVVMLLFILGHTYVGWSSPFRAAMVGGLLLCFAGVVMMYLGISVDGVMDIKSQIVTGSIRSSSAGFIVFVVGAIVCVLAIWRLGGQSGAG